MKKYKYTGRIISVRVFLLTFYVIMVTSLNVVTFYLYISKNIICCIKERIVVIGYDNRIIEMLADSLMFKSFIGDFAIRFHAVGLK